MPQVLKSQEAKVGPQGTLATALAEKGTPGLILLGLIFVTIWAPIGGFVYLFFEFIGTSVEFSKLTNVNAAMLVIFFNGVLGAGYVYMAYRLTGKIMQSIIPMIKAEAEATRLTEAFGGRVITASGGWQTPAFEPIEAHTRTRQIMGAMLERGKTVVSQSRVRANIFTLHDDGNLRICENLHVNMEGVNFGDKELAIAIPPGRLSSGRAFEYFRPVLSIKSNGKWPHVFESDMHDAKLEEEVRKAHPELKWIVSMPIPYQIQPFKLTCGVLNLDGLESIPTTQQLRTLFTDLSIAAALIGVLNRSTGFLKGKYSKPSDPTDTDQENLKDYQISPDEFDPASCPEPSEDFVLALSRISGLEFLRQTSQLEVAIWLRTQLRS